MFMTQRFTGIITISLKEGQDNLCDAIRVYFRNSCSSFSHTMQNTHCIYCPAKTLYLESNTSCSLCENLLYLSNQLIKCGM